jgi:hypothetical protein
LEVARSAAFSWPAEPQADKPCAARRKPQPGEFSTLWLWLLKQLEKRWMAFQFIQIRVLLHPVEIAIAQLNRLLERTEGIVLAFYEGKAARKIVVRRRIRWKQPNQFAIHP